jgi:AcrR family transcriptional regulator
MTVPVRQRVREDPVVRRQLIVDEAFRVIGQYGFNGFTVQVLAARCGLSNAGLLYYFGSKDRLLMALLDEVDRQETDIMAPLVAAAQDMPAITGESWAVRTQLLRTIVERFAERAEIGRFVMTVQSESLDPAHLAHDWFRERQEATLRLFEDMVKGLAPEPGMTARLLYALMNGLEQQWLRAHRGFDLLMAWDAGVIRVIPQD